ncbi:23S rRNA (adenine(2030)-N(6))-methyltransferase RlmJ [Ancylobacter terrae]|uniref:23S rRNA (adenine(2030)-N(6))-methyltransferase RlmJ n=1 Tax=Ancylobacter sp. sgz301288 TaxID=3342077 RepID=UPI003859D6A1
MNYRHAFHAGNFADVVKHIVLARVLTYLARKDSGYRYIDTHAGAGLYDLRGDEAERTGEWVEGVGAIHGLTFAPEVEALLAPWREAVAAVNPAGGLRFYPGSPLVARALARRQDTLLCCETVAGVRDSLVEALEDDRRAKVLALDGWQALRGQVPPRERRGVVLIDPPFEAPGEFDRLADGIIEAHRRWAGGVLIAWYPIKDVRAVDAFRRSVTRARIPKTLRIEFDLRTVRQVDRLSGCGLVVVNPPFTLVDEARAIFGALAPHLALDGEGRVRIGWLIPDA